MRKSTFRKLLPIIPLVLVLAVVVVPAFIWFFCRIEVQTDTFVVLLKKDGKNPDINAVISQPDEKGIQLEVLPEGRAYYNPFYWDWKPFPINDVPPGKLGVVLRRYGKDLPPGEIIAKEGTKGILRDIVSAGKYRYNPFAYDLQIFDPITIETGYVGVQVSLVGDDPLTSEMEGTNTFTVGEGEKGVIVRTLDAGTYYVNPYCVSIIPVSLQSKRFELSGEDAVDFLTEDGFPVRVEGTVEYAISRDNAALLTHKVGDSEDILRKIILPRVRGAARIEGSKGKALNYIVGEMRQEFQDNLEATLKEQCGKWGIEIRSMLVRNIAPPDEISSIIRDRELAKQDATMFEQQSIQAKSKAELAKQKMLAVQNKEKVTAETEKLKAKIKAEQEAQVRLTEAEQQLEVAKLEKAASEEQAGAIMARAEGEQTVIAADNEANRKVLETKALAFQSGDKYSEYMLYTNLASRIKTVLTNDDAEGLGGVFTRLMNESRKPNQTFTPAPQTQP